MQSSTSLSSAVGNFHPFFGRPNGPFVRPKGASGPLFASRNDAHDHNHNYKFSGRAVDENLIVLRKRIHEMKMAERNYEPPEHWMEWEKRCYTSYDSIVCDAIGLVQSQLMNARPSLALGAVALVALSLPVSAAVVLFHLTEMSREIVNLMHL